MLLNLRKMKEARASKLTTVIALLLDIQKKKEGIYFGKKIQLRVSDNIDSDLYTLYLFLYSFI